VIAGSRKSLPLKTVPGLTTRPTTDRIKETLFNMLNPYIPDTSFLDLFSGSGGIGIEALSRGASDCTFVDQSKQACKVIQENLTFTKFLSNGTILQSDALSALRRLESEHKVFQVVFMDPPYNNGLESEVLSFLEISPVISDDVLIVIEASLETDTSFVNPQYFEIIKEKEYKTNKHIWIRKTKTKQ